MQLISYETAFNTVPPSWLIQFTIMLYFWFLCYSSINQNSISHIETIIILWTSMLNAQCRDCMDLNWKNLYWEIKWWKNIKAVPQVQLTYGRKCFVKQSVTVSHWNCFLVTSMRTYCSSPAPFKWLFCIQNATREWTVRCSVATTNMGRDTNQPFLYTSSLPSK